MSDWQVGDLAQCVHPRTWSPNGAPRAPDHATVAEKMFFPQVGMTYRVYGVTVLDGRKFGADEGEVTYLRIDGFVPWFDHRYFKKVDAHTADQFDQEVIELMNAEPAEPVA